MGESADHFVELVLKNRIERASFRKELPQKAICVLAASVLSRRMWSREEHSNTGVLFNVLERTELAADVVVVRQSTAGKALNALTVDLASRSDSRFDCLKATI